MAKKYSEFYAGKKQKKRKPALIISVVALSLAAFLLLLFYGLQKYIVIANDGLHLDIPLLSDGRYTIEVNDEGENVKVYDPVEIKLVTGDVDYSNINATAGENVGEMKAVYIPAAYFTADYVRSEAAALQYGNAIMLEVKPASGALIYDSKVDFAQAYGTSGSADLAALVSELKGGEKEIYMVAELCCLTDNLVPGRNPKVALKDAEGKSYADGSGSWIDPYSADYRRYIADLCKELADMGFDEVVLNGLRLPTLGEGASFVYPGTTKPDANPLTACSGFALSVTRSLKSTDVAVSARLNSDTAFTTGEDAAAGQNAGLFFKIFDRVYYYTDVSAAQTAVESAQQYVELGDVNMRLVPVCYGATPETTCWVFVQG